MINTPTPNEANPSTSTTEVPLPTVGGMKISFGVKKKLESKVVTASVVSTAVESDESDGDDEALAAKRRKLTHLENGMFPDDEDDEQRRKKDKSSMIIPMVIENDWRVAKLMDLEKEGKLTDEDRAKLAILTEMQPFKPEESASDEQSIVVDEKEKADVEDANYGEVPIESFGLAILRGCGWKDGEGIGKNPQVVPLRLPNRRPKGLGLGALPPKPEKKKGSSTKEDDETSGEVTKGSLVKITQKPHAGMYGVVEGRDDDNNSCFVRLALKRDTVRVSLFVVVKVSKKEYDRESKCLNKEDYDREKEKIERNKEEKYGNGNAKDSKSRDRNSEKKEYLRRDDRNEELWVRADLVVRLVNDEYKNGRYMSQKMRVVDVADRKNVTLEDDDGKQHYNIRQSWVETVIPRSEGEKIMIVRGKGRGQPAVMEAKDKRREMVVARVIHSDEVFKVPFDDVCSWRPSSNYDSDN